MNYVYDSSFAASLIIPDEKNPKAEKIHFAIGENEEIFVPQLFWFEILNVFNNLLRRRRYTYDAVLQFIPPLADFQLTIDSETGFEYCKKILPLGREYNLSSYDAAYLELAARKRATLCTFDENLRIAAKKHGVTLIK